MKKKKLRCPQCGKEIEWEGNPWRPFCSERCRTIDLGRWAGGDYRIPGEKVEREDGEEAEKTDGNSRREGPG